MEIRSPPCFERQFSSDLEGNRNPYQFNDKLKFIETDWGVGYCLAGGR
ncbi:hypothetical protein OROHE_023364 [Orobanche hederae]